MAVAHGGQIVSSLAAAELVRDDLPEHWGLEYLGEHRLPDLGRAERVYQLTAPDLDDEFPPLRSLDAFPGNLGSQLTSLVGRERELESLGVAMRASRLVTLTGVGGVGKTRLANHIAALVVKRFRDGAWFCELAAANDDETLLQVVGAALGVSPHPSSTMEDSILDWLRPKRLLLVLDNCEHLIDAAGRFAESILFACPGVRILATSREGLGIEGEQIVALRSLSVPGAATTLEADRGERRGRALRRTRPCRARRLRDRAGERRRGRRDLPPARRDPPGDRAGRRPGRRHDAGRDRRPARRAVPPADRGTANRGRASSDPAPHRRLVVLVARRDRAHGVRPPRRVRGRVRLRGGDRDRRW